jgi:hypothetical protein
MYAQLTTATDNSEYHRLQMVIETVDRIGSALNGVAATKDDRNEDNWFHGDTIKEEEVL